MRHIRRSLRRAFRCCARLCSSATPQLADAEDIVGETFVVWLTAQGMTGTSIISVDGAAFEVDQRYLVAGEDGFAWGCGFSQPYDAAVAEDWARTFAP